MDKFVIEGGRPLAGTVKISRAKNAALPIMAAGLLAEGVTVIKQVPNLADIDAMADLLRVLGARVESKADGDLEIEVVDQSRSEAPYDLVRKMRAGFCVLGPLLARRGFARVSHPGGCIIGLRPIDLHIKGFRALGAHVITQGGYVQARADRLEGAHIFLGGPFGSTVLGTANVMMAATMAQGTTVIENAACEPEVVNLAQVLIDMGADITGVGSPRLVITGVKNLHGTTVQLIPDRIEAGTLLAAAAITRGDVTVSDVRPEHLSAVFDKLAEMEVRVEVNNHAVRVRPGRRPAATTLVTHPYPGFPTDLQAQFMTLLSVAEGTSIITEKIYPDRFMHIAELQRMAADIRKEGPNAIIVGVERLSGAPVMASDLRASAALVLGGLVADGVTTVNRVYHIDRGYERIEEKLKGLGASIQRVDGVPDPGAE